MALIILEDDQWTAPITLAQKSIVSINGDRVFVSFGDVDPTSPYDGMIVKSGWSDVFEENTILRFRKANVNRDASVYHSFLLATVFAGH